MRNIYLFYGEEDFLVGEQISNFKKGVDNLALNFEALDEKSANEENLSAALQTQPLLGGEKAVLVKKPKITAENQAGFIGILKTLPSGVKVAFQFETIDLRQKFFRYLMDNAEVVECRPFAPWEQDKIVGWIRQRFLLGNKRISDAAARLLLEISGANLRSLTNEIEKITTFTGNKAEVADKDILTLASPGERNSFELLDALREKDLKKTLMIFQALVKNRTDLFQLLGALAAQYRLMLQLKTLPPTFKDPRQAAEMVKGSPFFIKKCWSGLSKFTLSELRKGFEEILEVNLRLKTGESQPAMFELLLASLCGQ